MSKDIEIFFTVVMTIGVLGIMYCVYQLGSQSQRDSFLEGNVICVEHDFLKKKCWRANEVTVYDTKYPK